MPHTRAKTELRQGRPNLLQSLNTAKQLGKCNQAQIATFTANEKTEKIARFGKFHILPAGNIWKIQHHAARFGKFQILPARFGKFKILRQDLENSRSCRQDLENSRSCN
ncbi:unnamed protein product [Porites evermanni]|uniref:Uncharacterized protein n=1 Tax=Porites evermanni TaxID=104178 RepID=A0ABN8MFN0_9CNID|nr:unnamed protein product [Porites evermanni]